MVMRNQTVAGRCLGAVWNGAWGSAFAGFTQAVLMVLTAHSVSAAVPLTREGLLTETLHPYVGPTPRS